MNTVESLLVIASIALIHASFQLSVSMLTLLSSHTIGSKRSHNRLLALSSAFTFGTGFMTLLVIATAVLAIERLFGGTQPAMLWIAACGLLFGLGGSVWFFYYRRGQGTTLWLPRPLARYLTDRTKATKHSAEAFGLGLSSVAAELLFISVPVIAAVLLILQLEPALQLLAIGIYTLISLSPLLVIHALIGGGHRISSIQRWREENKGFMQFIAGSGLVAVGFYLYVDQVVTPSVALASGGF